METLEKEWEEYPVLRVDFSLTKYLSLLDLQDLFNVNLIRWEKFYDIEVCGNTPASRFGEVIRLVYEKTGKQVVVLIDEYDAPLLDSMNEPELLNQLRSELRAFFSPLKGQGQYLRFLLLTGISKFSQLSIFSELNNLQNISMVDEYSAICGITEQELHTHLRTDIEAIGAANNETFEEACAHLKQQYDGYHFSENCEDIYNPFSIINALSQKKYRNFWFSTGTPTFLIDLLQNCDIDIRSLDGTEAIAEQFDAPTDRITNPIPVLYQSGYLTIKQYDPLFKRIRWPIPTKRCASDSSSRSCLTMCRCSLKTTRSSSLPFCAT
jgi:hypothetical protein